MTTPINPLPIPPTPADSPVDFNTKAFALLGALPAFVTEANAQASGLDAAVAAAGLEADAAALKAGEALTSANNAALSKTGADSARDAAVIAKNAAEAALDSFDDRYLGAKAVAPTTDNDGGALLTGAMYWDTALPGMRSWNGSAWVTLPAATAAAISNTPAGSISATTVQAAINELATERFGKDNILGTVSQSAGVPTGALIEYGSNANGEYWRFAGGLQISARSALLSPETTEFMSTTAPPAAAFVSVSSALAGVLNITGPGAVWALMGTCTMRSVSSCQVWAATGNTFTAGQQIAVNITIVGRWA